MIRIPIIVMLAFFGFSFVCAQDTQPVTDPFYEESIYYGLAFFVQIFPDEVIDNDGKIYKKLFVLDRYQIEYKLSLKNGNLEGVIIIIEDYAYADFFDGLDESDYLIEECDNLPLQQEKFENHKLLFHDLAMLISDQYPNVSKLILTVEQVKALHNMIDETADKKLIAELRELEKEIEIEQYELIEKIREERPIIDVYDSYWVIVVDVLEGGKVHFEVYELSWGGIEPPETLDEKTI